MKDITIIDNILRTLIEIFADVVVSIEESKEIDEVSSLECLYTVFALGVYEEAKTSVM
ncbi:hypothetical protein MTR_2g033890 [Medicago truncatula]|uniref:Uncharacterized protein n=1 Tax=Medicago truncatula TaxID=3880 RepID=G7IMS9_MEDTR|nr:hypothetical protein MTR_2g033890 [Medicago truncatula]